MTPALHKRITEVFNLAAKLQPRDRNAFIKRECGDDEVLLKEVSARLSSTTDETQSMQAIPMQRIGKYQITGNLGSGGFGRVYRALDPTFGRVVAIKVLNTPDDSDIVRRFRTEATTVAKLQHKNIVTVHEFGEESGAPYLVMEFLDGTTLQELIERNSLTLLEKLEIMSAVAEGLQYAHERGVTHRDVKPANIMRLDDGSVKIMDFGIARIATESATRLTQTGCVVGSVRYMAPEQFNDGTSDALSDVFAYGITFYELLTGRNPFSSPDPAVVMFRIMNTVPPSVRTIVPECPDVLDRIVRRTLEKSREARYSSLSDVVVDAFPTLLELRRDHAAGLYAEAENFFGADQVDAARSAVQKVLKLDPVHAGARRLRAVIDEALQRRDLTVRASSLMDSIGRELRGRQYQEASELLNNLRQLGAADEHLQGRVEKAEAQIQQVQRCGKLLETARADLKNGHLTEAFRAVSEVLSSDPSSNSGKGLLKEIQGQMGLRETGRRLEEEIARVDGLLIIGETDQALAAVSEIGKRNPGHPQIPALRARAVAQKAQEDRSHRLAEGISEIKARLRNLEFDQAIGTINALLPEFENNPELPALRKHAAERLNAKLRMDRIASLKSEAASLIERQELDAAIRVLELGVAELGDDGELTLLLQTAVAGKAAQQQEAAVSRIVEEAEELRRSGKLDEAIRAVERAVRIWGEEARLTELSHQLAAEKNVEERKRAIGDVARKAGALLRQKKPQIALEALLQCIERHGGDDETQSLVQLAEAQVQEGERLARLKASQDEILKLAGANRFEEALGKAEEAIRAFPDETSLLAEHERLLTCRAQQQREAAIGEILSRVESLRATGSFADARRLVDDGLLKQGQDTRLLEARQYLAEGLAQQQRAEYVDKACKQVRSLQNQSRFDEALRVLDACEIRYPGIPAIAELLAAVKKDRDQFQSKNEIDKALADAEILMQREEPAKALEVLEETLKTHPESRKLADAATRVRSRKQEAERSRDIAQCAESIERALIQQEWNPAISRAAAAEEQFPGAAVFPRLKRRAEEGKHKAELDEAETSFAKALQNGNSALAGEIVTVALIRWPSEKRLRKLEDEIQLRRAEESVAQARELMDEGHYDEAERLANESLMRRPKHSSAIDLLEAIAARRTARAREEEFRSDKSVPTARRSRKGRRPWVWIAAGIVLAGGTVLWIVRPQPSPSVSRSQPEVAPAAFLVEAPPGSTMGVRGKDFSSLLRASGGLPPIQWRISEGVLPPGLGLNSETGGIAGRPSAVGAFAFAVIASDKAGNQASGRITITVAEPPDTKKPSEDAALADTRRQQKVDPPKEVPEAKKQPPIAPPETAPALPACKASSFVLEQYGDSRAGQLTWSGTLPGGGKLEIQNRRPSNGNLRGDILPKGVPVRVSVVPDTVRITTGPSAVNCWDPQLVLLNAGQAASEITIRWEVFQP